MIEWEFVAGLIVGSAITFVYVARLVVRLYHPIIRAQQRQIELRDRAISGRNFGDN